MNLQQAKIFTDEKVAQGYKSDGCTLAPDLGITWCCVLHDALIAYEPVTRSAADKLFFQAICTKGFRYYPVACLYYLAVRLQGSIGFTGILLTAIFTVFAATIINDLS